VLNYVLLDGPSAMALDIHTGVLSWTPTANDAAHADILLRAYDTRGGFAEQRFALEVAGADAAPQMAQGQISIDLTEGQMFELPILATDPEGRALSYYADQLPPGAVFDAQTALFSWTPGFDQAGEYIGVHFFVTDGVNTVQQVVNFIVHPANAAPQLAGVPERTVRQGDPIRIQLQGSDIDGTTLTYGGSFLPGGAWVDPVTGVFEWTPAFFQNGDFTFDMSASDGHDVTRVSTSVHVLNVNAAPVFDAQDGWTVVEGQTVSLHAFAFDPDNPGYIAPQRLNDGT
jgi:hypothetical protein